MAIPYIPCNYSDISDFMSPALLASNCEPAKRQRGRRGRRNGKKRQIKKQQEQHTEVVHRLDQICDLLQVAVDGITDARLAHQDSRSETEGSARSSPPGSPASTSPLNQLNSGCPPFPHAVCPDYNYTYNCGWGCEEPYNDETMPAVSAVTAPTACSRDTCRSPSHAESISYPNALSPGALRKLTDSIFLLEKELAFIRDCLSDIRTTVNTTPVDMVRGTVSEVVDDLGASIDQILSRIGVINEQQVMAGLALAYADEDPHESANSQPPRIPSCLGSESHDAKAMPPCNPESENSCATLGHDEWTQASTGPNWDRVNDLRSCSESGPSC
ncbi:hypothetical protein F5Y19DRAFT_478876 [Xylariaceae sp. FL1651]|nr:hypothetical protein F5Y19DRAFT_478876 [Xylariaceae sp. FL1651]